MRQRNAGRRIGPGSARIRPTMTYRIGHSGGATHEFFVPERRRKRKGCDNAAHWMSGSGQRKNGASPQKPQDLQTKAARTRTLPHAPRPA